jgi:hypothetical protein
MPYFHEQQAIVWSLPVLILLSGCGPKVECDSPETRNAVLKIVSNDHTNALATYAAKNSNVAKEPEKRADSESARPLYHLGETIVTTSTSADKRTLTCTGAISVIVGDTKASKEVNFTVQRPSGGDISVSVAPFQF